MFRYACASRLHPSSLLCKGGVWALLIVLFLFQHLTTVLAQEPPQSLKITRAGQSQELASQGLTPDKYIPVWLETKLAARPVPCQNITLVGTNFDAANSLTAAVDVVVTRAYKLFSLPSTADSAGKGDVKCDGSLYVPIQEMIPPQDRLSKVQNVPELYTVRMTEIFMMGGGIALVVVLGILVWKARSRT